MQEFIVIPRSFIRHWGDELGPLVTLKDSTGIELVCRVEPAPGDKGHFYTNTDAIKEAYEIDELAIMKIKHVRRHTFQFSFP